MGILDSHPHVIIKTHRVDYVPPIKTKSLLRPIEFV